MLAALLVVCAVAIAAIASILYPKLKKPAQARKAADLSLLAEDAFEWVDLPWFGKLRPFRLRKLNLLEIMTSGEFPNSLVAETMNVLEPGKQAEFSIEKQAALIEEKKKLLSTVARKSMVEPKYDELRGIMRTSTGDEWEYDLGFLKSILDYQGSGIPANAKKKSL